MNENFKDLMANVVFTVMIIAAELVLLIVIHSVFVKICCVVVIVLEILRIVWIFLRRRRVK